MMSATFPDCFKQIPQEFIIITNKKGEGIPWGINKGWSFKEATKKLTPDRHIQCHFNLKDTGIAVIDIDEDTFTVDELFEQTGIDSNNIMYTIGNTKGLHIYIKCDRHNGNRINCSNLATIDYLGGSVFERVDKEWNNGEIGFIEITDEMYNKCFQKPNARLASVKGTADCSTLEPIIKLISVEYINDYNSWRKIIWAAKNCGMNEEFMRTISKLSSAYTEAGFNNIWSADCLKLQEGTLRYYAKLSNLKEYNKLYTSKDALDIKQLQFLKPPALVAPDGWESRDDLKQSVKDKMIKDFMQEQMDYFNQEYEMKKQLFETFHFKVMSPACFGRIAYDKTHIMAVKDLAPMYENVTIYDPKKDCNVSFISKWRTDINIRCYERLDFLPYPAPCPDYIYNTFHGLRAEKLHGEGSISPFLDQLKLLVGKDEAGYEYMLNYLAHMVQKPGELPLVAILFKSDEGTGKNLFFENFCNKLFGNDFLLVASEIEKVLGRFSMIDNKLMVVLDETTGKDGFSNSDRIKSIITSEQIPWEQKGVNGIKLNNCGRYIFLSNNNTPLKISSTDRRMVVFKCSNDHRNDTVYFKQLLNAFNDDGCVRSFYEFLMNRDIDVWDRINSRPITKEYLDIQSATIPVMVQWLKELIQTYNNAEENEQLLLTMRPASELFKDFTRWLTENGFDFKYNTTSFGRELIAHEGIDRKKGRAFNSYVFVFKEVETYLISKNWGCD